MKLTLLMSETYLNSGERKMRKVMLTLAMVVGVIALMNLSQVGSAFADEVDCMACKAQVQGYCFGSSEGGRTKVWELQCMSEYIAQKCADACQSKSGNGDAGRKTSARSRPGGR